MEYEYCLFVHVFHNLANYVNNMYSKNFVRAQSPEQCLKVAHNKSSILCGDEARKLYIEEIKEAKSSIYPRGSANYAIKKKNKNNVQTNEEPLTNKKLFVYVQNNDVDKLKSALNRYPEKINILDDYGWSLLMISCQANSVETTKELLKRGINTSIRDKAGNSAQSLVIKNKNYVLADILIRYKKTDIQSNIIIERNKPKLKEVYRCDICNRTFPDRVEHLSSIEHNICASKGKRIPAYYAIPASNKGYQLMLKGGWDRESGLGRDGSGKKYPIKTTQKKDRKGLGHAKRIDREKLQENNVKHKDRKKVSDDIKRNRNFEINFRREFY